MRNKDLSPTKLSSLEELIKAGVLAVSEKGIDKVTVLDVISISGHSRPTFYSYFADINSLLAEIWIKYGIDALSSYSVDSDNWDNRTPDVIPGLGRTLLQIFCAAHRIPELMEVLSPDVTTWWKQTTGASQSDEIKAAWILGMHLGIGASIHVNENVKKSQMLIPVIRQIPGLDGVSEKPKMLDSMDLDSNLPEVLIEADLPENAILRATMSVVANSGVYSTTIARVARNCRVSTGTIYPRYKNQKVLVEKAFQAAIKDVVIVNVDRLQSAASPFEEFARSIYSSLSDRRRTWRDFRLEVLLASMYDEELSLSARSGFDFTRRFLSENIERTPEFDSQTAEIFSYAMEVLAVGFSMLHNAGVPLQGLRHRIMIDHIGASFAKTT
jgi:AcrR family transcriptional regulator